MAKWIVSAAAILILLFALSQFNGSPAVLPGYNNLAK
jgi:hypothetical protein